MMRVSRPNCRVCAMRTVFIAMAVVIAMAIGQPRLLWAQIAYEQEPISYATAEPRDPISRLQQRIDAGETRLRFDSTRGYLDAVLEALDVPTSSQMLVFSKTSFQRNRISPATPRAIYFNDENYIGWCQRGDVVEVSTVDPQLGAVFYTLDQREVESPKFVRQNDSCLQCHASSMTQGVPGHMVRSIYADRTGFPVLSAGSYRTNHESPIKQRWGGWYVTGKHGDQLHMGNVTIEGKGRPEETDFSLGANITDLTDQFRSAAYLSSHSDIVALMVLEHQTTMHNLLTLANYEGRIALRDEKVLQEMAGDPNAKRPESIQRRFEAAAERVVKYMLFHDETPLTSPISGTSKFRDEFAATGPRDANGRSLRDFDLERRLFKYPCSYLIYSPSFDELPAPVKDQVYRRLWEVTTGIDQSKTFSRLGDNDRSAIREILIATKSDLPDYWKNTN